MSAPDLVCSDLHEYVNNKKYQDDNNNLSEISLYHYCILFISLSL